ncbi:MAG TPA: proline--tRNA ligase [Solirubrobacteraceae bacterium]|jgi:prolyl-tRNA synthetase|nr:proline--tRNA ligase [Solirubrobacteraceae bacterium]
MPRLSSYLLPTEKHAPGDAEALSHRLMVRAGLIRQIGTGLWTWLPAGWRVHQRVVGIVREEMDAVGAQEMLMPVLQPAELWRRTGRYGIDELFKLVDRKGAEMVLAMTHEEAVTSHVAGLVRSYRDLPLVLYHFQIKERDEPRPRAGVLRTREFVMKDAYSFDRDADGLAESYERLAGAYDRIFERCGLEYYRVEADVGMMGGLGADEYMAPCPAGENEVALAPGFAANVEVASAEAKPVDLPAPPAAPEETPTPGLTTVEQVSDSLGVAPGALIKAFPVVGEDGEVVLALVRGDHRVNEIKLAHALGARVRTARAEEIEQALGPPGFIGPVGLDGRVRVLLDGAVNRDGGYVCGANRPDTHLKGVQPGRDFHFEVADIRSVEPGDLVGGHPVRIERAIEVGNIFKLGTRYSEPLGASYLDDDGREQPVWMGSYGIGPARIAAAAVEQFADEQGISWPRAIAPFEVHLVALGRAGTPEREAGEGVYDQLERAGVEVLYDDRDGGAGEKFADAELLGCPLRLTLGKRGVEAGQVEAQARRGRQEVDPVPLGEELVQAVIDRCQTLP